MGRLIEEQAVIDCLTNTAKYYELEDADEWTKGIHYGLLHGVDNILDNVPTVEAIPKDQYENRLKADMVAMLEEIKLEFEQYEPKWAENDDQAVASNRTWDDFDDIIQQKIDALKEVKNAGRLAH